MNLKELCDYLRIHIGSFRRNLYNGEYTDMPRKLKSVLYVDKKGKNKVRTEYEFDLKKVLKYLDDKYNQIKRI